MKIVYADMSIEQAKKYLTLLGEKSITVLDYSFGYSALCAQVDCISFTHSTDVFLVNSPSVLDLIKQDIEDDVGSVSPFVDAFYILTPNVELKKVGPIVSMFAGALAEIISDITRYGE